MNDVKNHTYLWATGTALAAASLSCALMISLGLLGLLGPVTPGLAVPVAVVVGTAIGGAVLAWTSQTVEERDRTH